MLAAEKFCSTEVVKQKGSVFAFLKALDCCCLSSPGVANYREETKGSLNFWETLSKGKIHDNERRLSSLTTGLAQNKEGKCALE